MIQISTVRCGLVVVAATVNDARDVTLTVGLTHEGARRRLLRVLDRRLREVAA